MVDGWMGDDWFHNGAFRVSSLDFAVGQATNKAEGGGEFALGGGDDYTRYLEAGSMADFAKMLGIEHYPGVRKFLENPAYTDFWSLQAVDKWLAAQPLTVPTMLEVGQWDQEDSYGAPAVYRALEPKDTHNDMVSLVIGPWRHSGANHYGYDLGSLTFTGDTAREWRVQYVKPFFDHWLKGAPDPHTPPVLTYATGVNKWQSSPRWPMGVATPIYLADNGAATFERPAAAGHYEYVSDPAHPVPFIPRPIDMDDPMQWKPWLVHDQRFVSDRPDVAGWKSAPLDKPVHIMGAPEVDLFASTTGTDSDWVVKLIDVYPNDVPEPAVARREARDGRLRVADRHRDLSRTLSEELRDTRAAQVGSRGALSLDAAQRRPRIPAGSPDHGADPVEPVPALRSQSADLRRQHHVREARRLSEGDAEHLVRR